MDNKNNALAMTTAAIGLSAFAAYFMYNRSTSKTNNNKEDMSASFSLIIQLEVVSAHLNKFKDIIRTSTLEGRKEAGCIRFDTLVDPSNPHVFWIYEIYENKAAYDMHISLAPFADFKKFI